MTYNGVTYPIGVNGGYLVSLTLSFSSTPATVPTTVTTDPITGNIQTDAAWNNIAFTTLGNIQLTTLDGTVIFSDSFSGSGVASGSTEQNTERVWDQTFNYQFTGTPEPGSLVLMACGGALLFVGKLGLCKKG